MKDVVTPVAPEEVRAMIQTSLENAALLNYTQLSQKANIEGQLNLEYGITIITCRSRNIVNLENKYSDDTNTH